MVGSVVSTSNGLAKGSKLGSYRVFGCNGTTTDDIIIRAVDRAIQDGCDVINLSLAGEAGYPDSVSLNAPVAFPGDIPWCPDSRSLV